MQEPDKVVRLNLDPSGMPVPALDPIPVKKGRQKVKFCATFPFTIDIENYSDVKKGDPDDDGPHNVRTGVFNGDQKQYKYSITANGFVNDPTLEVEP